jgi:predicted dehydrogenase
MKPEIVIVGAGQLGSRYLQGLARSNAALSIHVVDLSREALDTAEKRWQEAVYGDMPDHSVAFHQTMGSLPKEVDLAIISTGSNARGKVVQLLKEQTAVTNWLLEKVLAQDEQTLDSLVETTGQNAWVNTYFRTLDWFKKIKAASASGPVHIKVTGGNWGIGCNTIHIIDFISWWTGESVTAFNTSALEPEWFPAKRPGFWEINGTLKADFSGGSKGTFISDHSTDPFELQVFTPQENWRIEWEKGVATRNDGHIIEGRFLYQSEMTAQVVADILGTGSCALPSLAVSAEQHRIFLKSLLTHWQQNKDASATAVPVT